MEARLVRHTPCAQQLIRKRVRCHNCAEEVHTPLRILRLTVVDIEEAERDVDGRLPELGVPLEGSPRREAVEECGVPEAGVQRSAFGTDFGRVEDGRLKAVVKALVPQG